LTWRYFMHEPNLRRWQEIAVQYWTLLRIIIRAGLSDRQDENIATLI